MEEEKLCEEILSLKKLLQEKENKLQSIKNQNSIKQPYGLFNEEIITCSRQILLPEIGITGQIKLKNASVLLIGIGGLGCPSALYLVRCGIGHIGLVDYDDVELSNLHRQTLFSYNDLGMSKVEAAKEILTKINKYASITPYKMQIDSTNAIDVIKNYDVIVDCTDNVATRYLLNDSCVIAGKPLVSGAALRFEGQLTVYNYENGPCYRCVFPHPPPPETVGSCGDSGILGPVVGTIGILQALEVIKILLQFPRTLSGEMLVFDGLESKFRNIKLRNKNKECSVCGLNPTILTLVDYEQFCGAKANDKHPNLRILNENERIDVDHYQEVSRDNKFSCMLIDVRSSEEFQICKIKNSINIPFSDIEKSEVLEHLKQSIDHNDASHLFVICRRGNDSQKAVRILQKSLEDKKIAIKDIIGGMHEWSRKVEITFPVY